MADEPDDIEPDLLRERLLMLAGHGEITGKQAEATAAAHGLEPFERKPELPRFDPTLKAHWSIVMAVAWIAWRDFGARSRVLFGAFPLDLSQVERSLRRDRRAR